MNASIDRTLRRALLASLVSGLASCSHDGGGSIAVSIRPGESLNEVLEIHAGDAEGGELTSCDLATTNTPDRDTSIALQQMDVVVGKPARSAKRSCGVEVTLTAHDDAVPGDYRVEVVFFYSFTAPLQAEQEGSDIGSIVTTITP